MDCTAGCRLASHADVVLSAVTREELNDVQSFIKYFCGNGVKVCDSFGRNALHIAASCGKKDVLKWLLEEGYLDIEEKDKESGWTALHRSCYYGQLSCALLLLQFGANIYATDFEGLTPVELLMLDSLPKIYSLEVNGSLSSQCKEKPHKKAPFVDVSSWGTNTNFTLGHGDQKERHIPEVIDVFVRPIRINICEVVVCKFHTVFLSDNGSVWTCGHGQGGRLGHGHEKTILVPKRIEGLTGQTCISIAAGQDHTVVLCQNGYVFTFGLNKYHQLGHYPPLSHYLTPKQIQIKALKGKRFKGIAAGKYHTVIYTNKEVYTCGLNAGQLGHSKGEKTQVTPRQVSALHLQDISISLMTCNDAATVALTRNGDVHLMYQNNQKRIISKISNISKLIVVGGCLDHNCKEITEKKRGPLVLYGCYENGKVFQWRESDKCVRECHWSLQKAISVKDVAWGKNLHIVTDNGEVYFEEQNLASVKRPTKIISRNLNFISSITALKLNEVIEIPLTRVQRLHRAVKIACDDVSQNFAVLQADACAGCSVSVHVTSSEMRKHLFELFENCQQSGWDLEIKVKGSTIFCHKFVVAHGSEKLRRLINQAESKCPGTAHPMDSTVLHLDDENSDIIGEIVEFLYTGTCPSLQLVQGTTSEDISVACCNSDEYVDELAWILEEIDFGDLDNFQGDPFHERHRIQEERRMVAEEKSDRLSKNMNHRNEGRLSVDLSQKKELLHVAKKYKIDEMVPRLQGLTIDKKRFCPRFYAREYPEYHDVVIEAEDGVKYECHKCILAARLEYFAIMLTTTWMESCDEFARLKMSIPSKYLKVVLDFLYTDDAPIVKDSQDLEFIGNILTVADQLWIIRLKEICERKLASLISLKNSVEMLEFSSLYNANQLKDVCLEFICRNMSCLFEARGLEFLSEEILEELSKTYRETLPSMAWRVLTPSDLHFSVPWPQPESPNKPRRSSRSQRKSRSSESESTGESQVVQENGTKQDENLKRVIEEEKQTLAKQETSEHNGVPEKNNEKIGLWYRKDTDMAPKVSSSTFVSSTGRTKTVANPLPISGRNDNKLKETKPWEYESVSPQLSDLRAIMEQEKSCSTEKEIALNDRKKEGRSPSGGKTRISQKERRRLRKSFEEQLSSPGTTSLSDNNITTASPSPTKPNPWKSCLSLSPPAVSFRDLLKEEEKEELKGNRNKKKKDISLRSCELVTVKVSPGSVLASPSPWQSNHLACSPPNNPIKFDEIQEIQQQEIVYQESNRKKALSLIQIEDKAIEQLLEQYGGRFNPCELIEVKRERKREARPAWVK